MNESTKLINFSGEFHKYEGLARVIEDQYKLSDNSDLFTRTLAKAVHNKEYLKRDVTISLLSFAKQAFTWMASTIKEEENRFQLLNPDTVSENFERDLTNKIECDQLLSILDPVSKDLMRKHYIEGYSIEELCATSDLEIEAIKSKLQRAKLKIREQFS